MVIGAAPPDKGAVGVGETRTSWERVDKGGRGDFELKLGKFLFSFGI